MPKRFTKLRADEKRSILEMVRHGDKFDYIAFVHGRCSSTVAYLARSNGVYRRREQYLAVRKQRAEIARMAREGVSYRAIAKQFGISSKTAQQIGIENGVIRKPHQQKLTFEQRLEICRLVDQGDYTKQEIARQFGVSRRTIGIVANQHGATNKHKREEYVPGNLQLV